MKIPDKIVLRVANNYGTEVFYPACRLSQLFADIAGTKTLTGQNVARILVMGFEIDYIATRKNGEQLP